MNNNRVTILTLVLSHIFIFIVQAENARETKVDPISQRNSSFASSQDVWKFISELGISKVNIMYHIKNYLISTIATFVVYKQYL